MDQFTDSGWPGNRRIGLEARKVESGQSEHGEYSEGFEINLACKFTNFMTGVLTVYYSEALNRNLYVGFATGKVPGVFSTQQFPIAQDRQDTVVQANMLMKF